MPTAVRAQVVLNVRTGERHSVADWVGELDQVWDILENDLIGCLR